MLNLPSKDQYFGFYFSSCIKVGLDPAKFKNTVIRKKKKTRALNGNHKRLKSNIVLRTLIINLFIKQFHQDLLLTNASILLNFLQTTLMLENTLFSIDNKCAMKVTCLLYMIKAHNWTQRNKMKSSGPYVFLALCD